MISQIFILSNRGDTIISRHMRGDLVRTTHDLFFRQVRTTIGDSPPVLNIEGINFLYLRKNGLYIVASTVFNVSASFVFEMLNRLSGCIKDFCGVLSEESIRKNFVYVYEILEEFIDYGYPQSVNTDQIRPYLVNTPIAVAPTPSLARSMISRNSLPSTAVQRPLDGKQTKNDIFVDIIEKLSVVFNASGYIVNSSLEGFIQMKSYLQGNPRLRLGLNEDLQIAHGPYNTGLVDYNFSECVDSSEFDTHKILTIAPPDGEFVAMNYRVTGELQLPFRIFPFIEEVSPYKIEVIIRVKACIPEKSHGSNVFVRCNLPSTVNSVHIEKAVKPPGQMSEWREAEQVAEWGVKKFQGGQEYSVKMSIGLSAPGSSKILGPISMDFEIPMYNVSMLSVKYLRTIETMKKDPNKWVRYVTQASSYVCRIP